MRVADAIAFVVGRKEFLESGPRGPRGPGGLSIEQQIQRARRRAAALEEIGMYEQAEPCESCPLGKTIVVYCGHCRLPLDDCDLPMNDQRILMYEKGFTDAHDQG